MLRNIVRLFFQGFIRVFHGTADAGRANHRKVIFRVTGTEGMVDGNPVLLSDEVKGRTLAYAGQNDLQEPGIGLEAVQPAADPLLEEFAELCA